MPIYAYRCEQCGHQQDVLQKMSDPLLVTCPECGQATYRKQVTAAGFQLKGSGWYVTDFRNPAAKQESKGVAKADADSGSAKEGTATTDSSSGAEAAKADKPAPVPAKSEAAPAPSPKPASGSGNGGSGGTS